jgi:hypothetical protein
VRQPIAQWWVSPFSKFHQVPPPLVHCISFWTALNTNYQRMAAAENWYVLNNVLNEVQRPPSPALRAFVYLWVI